MRQRQPRIEDKGHLAFIRSLRCLVCGTDNVDAAHIRYTDAAAGKFNPGVGAKPDDRWTVPLCRRDHSAQHSVGEKRYWQSVCIDPIDIAKQLYAVSGDYEQGCKIVARARPVNILAVG